VLGYKYTTVSLYTVFLTSIGIYALTCIFCIVIYLHSTWPRLSIILLANIIVAIFYLYVRYCYCRSKHIIKLNYSFYWKITSTELFRVCILWTPIINIKQCTGTQSCIYSLTLLPFKTHTLIEYTVEHVTWTEWSLRKLW
jgi:hypothetical protein